MFIIYNNIKLLLCWHQWFYKISSFYKKFKDHCLSVPPYILPGYLLHLLGCRLNTLCVARMWEAGKLVTVTLSTGGQLIWITRCVHRRSWGIFEGGGNHFFQVIFCQTVNFFSAKPPIFVLPELNIFAVCLRQTLKK